MNPRRAPSRLPDLTAPPWQPVQPKLPYSQKGSSLASWGPRGLRRWMSTTGTFNCFVPPEVSLGDQATRLDFRHYAAASPAWDLGVGELCGHRGGHGGAEMSRRQAS